LDRIAKALGLSITKLAELAQEGEPVAEPTAGVLEKPELIGEPPLPRLLIELELSEPGVVSGKWRLLSPHRSLEEARHGDHQS
jgi:hypothetical protein